MCTPAHKVLHGPNNRLFGHRNRLLLDLEWSDFVSFARDVKQRLGFGETNWFANESGTNSKRREKTRALRPDDVANSSAVGKSGRVNTPIIDPEFLMQLREDFVDEFQITITILAR